MNCVIASNVVCCVPVAVSPEAAVKPAGESPPNAIGIPPAVLNERVNAFATAVWFAFSPL